MGFFNPKQKMCELKIFRGVRVTTIRMMQSLKNNWLVISKSTGETWQILTPALKSLQNFCFNGLLFSNVYVVWAREVQESYLSWYWRNLDRNWLVVSKLTWGIWQILTRALNSFKNLQVNGLFLTKVYNV